MDVWGEVLGLLNKPLNCTSLNLYLFPHELGYATHILCMYVFTYVPNACIQVGIYVHVCINVHTCHCMRAYVSVSVYVCEYV